MTSRRQNIPEDQGYKVCAFSSISRGTLQYGRNHCPYKRVAYMNFVGAYTACLVRYEKWE